MTLPLHIQDNEFKNIPLNRTGSIALTSALLFVVASVLFTNHLAHRLAKEEAKSIEIWAEATRQIISADEDTDIDFYSSIIEDNTNIPVYMLDGEGNILETRNVKRQVKDPTELHGPIEVTIADDYTQYIYYDDSYALKQLRVLPYIEFGIIVLFVLIALAAISIAQRSEQDRLWAGLSKETAHQLGTPISSLIAWQELLKATYPDDKLIPEMKADIYRLQAIADRFSKIGSKPELTDTPVMPLIEQTVSYMRRRMSKSVRIELNADIDEDTLAALNPTLFQWVLENLIKNSVDAMDANGTISIHTGRENDRINIDVTDTGKGIEKSKQSRIFDPGFTTKTRGWGLGLSLSKRIIEDYHRGKIFVKHSQIGIGTTIRITLEYAENGTSAA